ncbi:D-aminoacyl-tRNA deacylase [Ottowia sp.]|uniref:D-aminoacyl-tRNA deacylase n=1 Tax=Ottowia sp. TaxID=1898956 RepID=UPI0001B04DCB|nr:D-aminoacyl-tRNA deacylase [Ottowia sp.]BAH89675.1 D-tyrosyl-tRNA(Tyr) deacylase [uncultured bacterium]HRN75719.1 D-aminoacyl-tRNA deacylase [Ottowia sp.]HRQ03418.1 D-aminoacyl-tRNA deacylase [Ottowia sp.]
MQALIQRVSEARVSVAGRVVGEIGPGLLVLLCAEHGDDEALADRLLAKLLKLRIFSDAAGKMNRSVQDVGGGLLIVSQFTLAVDTSGGNRPSFTNAAAPEVGRRLYEHFVAQARATHPQVATGEFAADMRVHLVNDGPVTIPLRIS